jgi:hypothetical protein
MRSGLSSPALETLSAAIDQLEAENVSLVLGAELRDIQRLQDRLAAQGARRLAVFDRERGFAADGSCSTVAWLRGHCRLSNGAARTRVSIARQIGELPQTSAAFARGDITYAHVAGICRTADQLGTALVAGAEPILVPAARELNAGKFGYTSRRTCVTRSIPTALSTMPMRSAGGHTSTSARPGRATGSWTAGSIPRWAPRLQTALNALMPRPALDDLRFPSERRAQALVELARRQLDGGALPQVAGVKPHVSTITTVETLKRESGAPPADLEWGPPVHMETARRIACDCALTTVAVDSDGELLDYGRTRRTVPPALRRVLVMRDRGCAWPDCDRPPAWTSGHHLRHWADGGSTNKVNTALLCGHHHWRVHEGGWRLEWGPDGRLVARPP